MPYYPYGSIIIRAFFTNYFSFAFSYDSLLISLTGFSLVMWGKFSVGSLIGDSSFRLTYCRIVFGFKLARIKNPLMGKTPLTNFPTLAHILTFDCHI